MKQGIHPDKYKLVIFRDMSNGHEFLSRSTASSKETSKWEDGNEYPLIKLEISNMSHPFYTGKNMLVDTAGRIDKFNKRYAKINNLTFLEYPSGKSAEGFLFTPFLRLQNLIIHEQSYQLSQGQNQNPFS